MPQQRRTTQNASSRGTGRSAALPEGARPVRARTRARTKPGRGGSLRATVATGQRVATSTLVLIAAVILALVALVPIVNTYVSQQQDLAALKAQAAEERQRVDELEAEIARWEDPSFVKAQARERLLFAMPGETQYRLTDSSGKEIPLDTTERHAQEAQQHAWFGTMWDSLVASSQASGGAQDATTDDPAERNGSN